MVPTWLHFEGILGILGGLDAYWGLLGASWGRLGAPWSVLGRPGTSWGRLGAQSAPKMTSKKIRRPSTKPNPARFPPQTPPLFGINKSLPAPRERPARSYLPSASRHSPSFLQSLFAFVLYSSPLLFAFAPRLRFDSIRFRVVSLMGARPPCCPPRGDPGGVRWGSVGGSVGGSRGVGNTLLAWQK